jgi:hypothetical protein
MNEQAWSYGRDWSALITIGDPLNLVGTFAGSKTLRIRSGQSSLPRKGRHSVSHDVAEEWNGRS